MTPRLESLRRAVRSLPALAAGLVLVALGAVPAAASVTIDARVARRQFAVGDATTLEVTVRGAVAAVRDPEFGLPDGLEVLGSGRSQNVSAQGGTTSTSTVFRFEVAANRSGRYTLGPFRVQVGGQTYEAAGVELTVTAADRHTGSSNAGPGAANLLTDVTPNRPYVGQPVVLRVRLIQRTSLAEDPRYTPPSTPGFWAERASQPESYYADEGGTRVLVTETRTRLYPLAAGEATIGSASAMLALSTPAPNYDPLRWVGGRPPRRDLEVHSEPLRVATRALPPGAPAGYDGAVGQMRVEWSADRTRTSLDVPVTLRFEVRGVGNLPLLHVPELSSTDFEIFGSAVEDSLSAPGTLGVGMRRFQWTALPKHQGKLEIPAPAFSWFDPDARVYYLADEPTLAIDVGPPMAANAVAEEGFPSIFATQPVRPFGREAIPWTLGLVGLGAGAAVRLWRRASKPPADAADRASQRQWIHAVGRGGGSEFWTAADQACGWLEDRGRSVQGLRRQIASTRYGGNKLDPDTVRRILINELNAAIPPVQPRWVPRVGAVALLVASVIFGLLVWPRGGDARGERRLAAADQAARGGAVERAAAEWRALWREGARHPAVAARLAWSELQAGEIGQAALWALRGERLEARDPSLDWMIQQIRETGGLTGHQPTRLPVRRFEWALLALVAGLATMLLWPRLVPAGVAGALFLLAAFLHPVEGWWADRSVRAVVASPVTLEGTELELEPGQVVTVIERSAGRARAEVGHGAVGWLSEGSLELLERTP